MYKKEEAITEPKAAYNTAAVAQICNMYVVRIVAKSKFICSPANVLHM